MGGYIANFTVYTMAMTGLICFAVFIYKKVMDGSVRSNSSKSLYVEESMSLTPRKTLHIVRAGNEKFLIASDVDRTTLISKLNDSKISKNSKAEQFEFYKKLGKDENIENATQEITKTQTEQITNTQTKQRKKVHLEPITTKKQNNTNTNTNTNTVILDFETPKSHGFSTMREMAKKINEL